MGICVSKKSVEATEAQSQPGQQSHSSSTQQPPQQQSVRIVTTPAATGPTSEPEPFPVHHNTKQPNKPVSQEPKPSHERSQHDPAPQPEPQPEPQPPMPQPQADPEPNESDPPPMPQPQAPNESDPVSSPEPPPQEPEPAPQPVPQEPEPQPQGPEPTPEPAVVPDPMEPGPFPIERWTEPPPPGPAAPAEDEPAQPVPAPAVPNENAVSPAEVDAVTAGEEDEEDEEAARGGTIECTEEDIAVERAAGVIQRVFRGHAVRRRFRRMLVCHSCGEQFSYASLPSHQRDNQCVKAERRERNLRLPKRLRGKVASAPELSMPVADSTKAEYDAYNREAMEAYRAAMPTCACGRKFFAASLAKHVKYCDAAQEDARDHAATKIQRRYRRHRSRRMLVCYSCGQQFSYASLPIHQRDNQCVEAETREVKRVVPSAFWGTAPTPPDIEMPTEDSSPAEYERYNRAARATYQASMPTCACGRKFFPSSLVKHIRHCNAAEKRMAAVRIQSQYRAHQARTRFRKILVCYSCGEQFSYASLPIHQRDNQCVEAEMRERELHLPEHLRGEMPQPPETEMPTEDSPEEQYKAYNREAQEHYRAAMPTCACGRKFFPASLVKHIRHCDKYAEQHGGSD